jgi:phosphate-selective porin OprO/OprP
VACASEWSSTVKQQAYGLEAILASGPFKLVGEYSAGDYKGTSATQNTVSYDTKTYYVEAGWFITGEKYASSYKNGVFSSFKPINDFDIDKGNWGALEALVRFEGYDVENAKLSSTSAGRLQGSLSPYKSGSSNEGTAVSGIEAGAKTYTAGIRWILNPNVVIKGNYSYTRFDNAFAPIDVTSASSQLIKDEKLLMFRTQFMF